MAACAVDESFPQVTDQPKKRPKLCSTTEIRKLEALSGHQTGEDCRSTRLHCFQFTYAEERHSLVGHFNSVFNKDAQDSLLAALINVRSVERKLPIPGVVEEAQNPHDHSYKYHVKVLIGGNAVSIQVCIRAFLYTYDRLWKKNGSNDVVSMISHFIDSYQNPDAI
ncbi:30S ribosomal protein s20 [Plakobranchus ocellatus]|uniref:30S ribosomal protein s20 n=1 Tax=Plakobranchus ocellatus TaxID=259542 RepID=A0AAV4A582_9GAST|nr:30S ribosomal protein s20 [Plakobranchus ocellatus]